MASDLKLFQRLMNVAEQQNSLSQHYTNTALAQDLWQQYREALNSYLLLCSSAPPSYHPLYDPFLYFYRGKNDDIRTTVRYTYGQHRTSNRLTHNGFPYLLQAFFEPFQVISFPTTGPAVDHLYQTLTDLILNYPYDRLSRLYNELKKYSPQVAIKLNPLTQAKILHAFIPLYWLSVNLHSAKNLMVNMFHLSCSKTTLVNSCGHLEKTPEMSSKSRYLHPLKWNYLTICLQFIFSLMQNMQSSMTRIQTISVSVLSPPMMQYWAISQK